MKTLTSLLLCVATLFATFELCAQNIRPSSRARVIIDNDFSGDPDGLVALAHQLLSPSIETTAIIGSYVNRGWSKNSGNPARDAVEAVDELLAVMGLSGEYKVYQGSATTMTDPNTPIESEGARAIIAEAMRDDSRPLYVLCGASLNTIASAWLMEPAIADRLTVVWIGGQEYAEIPNPAPADISAVEYNLNLSIAAAQCVFNNSNLRLWQVPRSAYRQTIFTRAEMQTRLAGTPLGDYLYGKLTGMMDMLRSETYVLGDSPLVLLTALQTLFEPDSASSLFCNLPAPYITDEGLYDRERSGRTIRVYATIDNRTMFEDMCAKFLLHSEE